MDASKQTSEISELILRDKLALDRTRMANQRTLLAYVRTGMYFTVTALGVAYLGNNNGRFGWVEWVLTGIGSTIVLAGLVNYFIMRKKILRESRK